MSILTIVQELSQIAETPCAIVWMCVKADTARADVLSSGRFQWGTRRDLRHFPPHRPPKVQARHRSDGEVCKLRYSRWPQVSGSGPTAVLWSLNKPLCGMQQNCHASRGVAGVGAGAAWRSGPGPNRLGAEQLAL